MTKRLSWDEYFLNIAETVSLRSTCNCSKQGAVLVKDNQVLTTGYNGSLPKEPHCNDPELYWQCSVCGASTTTKPDINPYIWEDEDYLVCPEKAMLCFFGYPNVEEKHGGCIIKDNKCVRSICAEQNVISFAARQGIQVEGAVLYTLNIPCQECIQLLIQTKISEVIYKNGKEDNSLYAFTSTATKHSKPCLVLRKIKNN